MYNVEQLNSQERVTALQITASPGRFSGTWAFVRPLHFERRRRYNASESISTIAPLQTIYAHSNVRQVIARLSVSAPPFHSWPMTKQPVPSNQAANQLDRSPNTSIYSTLQKRRPIGMLLRLLHHLLLVTHLRLHLLVSHLGLHSLVPHLGLHPILLLLRHPILLMLRLLRHVPSIAIVHCVGVATGPRSERPRDHPTHSWGGEGVVGVHPAAVCGLGGLRLHSLDGLTAGDVVNHANEHLQRPQCHRQ